MRKRLLFLTFGLLAFASNVAHGSPLGTAFTYQGRLDQNRQPALDGLYQMSFSLFAQSAPPGAALGSNPSLLVPVTNGLFTVELDFGSAAFAGEARWLEIAVRTNNGALPYNVLSPRTRLAPTPNAIYASIAGSVPNNSILASQFKVGGTPNTGQLLAYDGSSLIWQDPPVGRLSLPYSGNALSPTPLLQINNSGMAASSDAIVGTTSSTAAQAAAIRGIATSPSGLVIGVQGRATDSPEGTGIVGVGSATGGYFTATHTSGHAAIFDQGNVGIGTFTPQARLHVAGAILSGLNNTLTGDLAAIGGGVGNTADGETATVPGGAQNMAAGRGSFAAGMGAKALHDGSFVWADKQGVGALVTPFESTGNNQFNVRASGGVRFETRYLQVSGNNNEDAYIGGDGAGGDVHLGSLNPAVGTVALYNAGLNQYMHLTMKSCTILGGADLAEPFQISTAGISKGSVVTIDPEQPGKLKLSTSAYDKRVAGITSGANGVNPGIALQQQGVLEGGENVALSGRVYVRADAAFGAIEPGDLLTTSDTPGHAMKATDSTRAQGAILGKAMSALADGKGMVLVLVTLQ